MSLRDKIFGTSEARTEHREAKAELERDRRQSDDETPAYLTANQRVIAAEQNLPKWRRYPS